jgi:GNAT superfamily N-acetyltransferase
VYFSEMHKVVERLLKTCKVHIACDEANVNDIYGYACHETVDSIFVLHFIYVKHTYRNLGIGTMLLNSFNHNPEYASVYTQNTPIGMKLAAKYRMVYNPYVALTPDYRPDIKVTPPKSDIVQELEKSMNNLDEAIRHGSR